MVIAIGDTKARPKGGTAEYRSASCAAGEGDLHEGARARARGLRRHAIALREHREVDDRGPRSVLREASA
eukprot:3570239-Prymnesium_polylepis.1